MKLRFGFVLFLSALSGLLGLAGPSAWAFDYPEETKVHQLEDGFLKVVTETDWSHGKNLSENCTVSLKDKSYRVWKKSNPLVDQASGEGVFHILYATQVPAYSSGPKTVTIFLHDQSEIHCKSTSSKHVLTAGDVTALLGNRVRLETPTTYPFHWITNYASQLGALTNRWWWEHGRDEVDRDKRQTDAWEKEAEDFAHDFIKIAPSVTSPQGMINSETKVLPLGN
jgi:hypothetical protein